MYVWSHIMPTKHVRTYSCRLRTLFLFRKKSPEPRTPDMHLQVRDRGATRIVAVSGRITIDSSPQLLSVLFQCLSASGRESLIVDLSNAVYMDTSALAVFLETLRAARKLKKTFQLSGLGGRPRYLLEATGFIRLFSEVPQETSA
jgi:anti-anti-sigma factor